MFPVLTTEQMRHWESDSWAAGVDSKSVIHQAGVAVGMRVDEFLRTGGGTRVLVLAGAGHNGDDALEAAEYLKASYEVRVLRVAESKLPECINRFSEWVGESAPDLIIDGLFGIGLNRPLSAEWCQVMELVNAMRSRGSRIVSVDVPSGLDSQGNPNPAAICADITLTMGAPKTCLICGKSADFTGQVEVLSNIGLCPCKEESGLSWLQMNDFTGLFPKLGMAAHKGSRGHLLILAGSLGYHGAAVLAASAASAAMPGLITVCTMPDVYIPVASQLQVQMVHPWSAGWKIPKTVTAILVGPGLAGSSISEEFRCWVVELWKNWGSTLIADASALDWLPVGHCRGLRVITPHPGEAARCLGVGTGEVQSDRVNALQRLSAKYGATVVLKGYQTLIGCEQGPIYLNPYGCPGLAQGGSGDVLAGFLGGLLASPEAREKAMLRIAYGVARHGFAAMKLDAAKRKNANGATFAHWNPTELITRL